MIVDLSRNTALVRIRQQHQITARQGEVGRHARAFGADRSFGDLHDDLAAGRIETGDVALGDSRSVAPAAFALDDFDAAVEGAGHDIPVVQEGVFFKTDVHEGCLQPVFQILDFAFENAPHEAFVTRAFDGELFEFAFFQDRDAGFERLGVDDDFLVELLHGFHQALNLLDDSVGDAFDGVHDSLGRLFLDLHGFEAGFLLFHFGGNGQVGLAEIALFGFTGFGRFREGRRVGRQAGGEVFRALNFALVSGVVEDRFFAWFVA